MIAGRAFTARLRSTCLGHPERDSRVERP